MKLLKSWHLDFSAVAAALRTAGGLLVGNSLVVPVLRDFKDSYWWILLVVGIGLIIIASFSKKDSS